MPKIVCKLVKFFLFSGLVLLLFEVFLYGAFIFSGRGYPLISENNTINVPAQRVLCLGDSFTYGLGAKRNYSYPEQLERLLNYNNPEKKFKVFYYGINGLSSSIVANNLADNINKYKPDILVILAGCNDRWNLYQSNLLRVMRGEKINDRFLKVKMFLYNFRTFRFLEMLTDKIKDKIRNTRGDNWLAIRSSDVIDDNLCKELVEYNYEKIMQVVKIRGGRVRLFFQTYPTGPALISDAIKSVAEKYSIEIIDQAAVFSKVTASESLVANDGWHLNARGYNLMAKNIYEEFLNERIIDNKLTKDIEIQEREELNGAAGFNQNTWEYDLMAIARQPEKIVGQRDGGLYFWQNSVVDLPEVTLLPGEYVLQVRAKGTPVDGVYPLAGFYYKPKATGRGLKRHEINKVYVNGEWNNYFSEKVIISEKQNVTFYISFENDAMRIKDSRINDRNLYINKIILLRQHNL